jgi:hypothetical protein
MSYEVKSSPLPEPIQHLVCVLVRRKHRIEYLSDPASFHNLRHAFDQLATMILEGRELERFDQFELCVTQDFEWKVNPVNEFF